jgi:uncharacterized protein YukE
MTFRVDPDEIRLFASSLATLGEDAEIAKAYIDRLGSFTVLEAGAIGLVVGRHRAFVETLNETMQRLAGLLHASSANMQATATRYQRADERSAAEIDASYPASPRPIPGVA